MQVAKKADGAIELRGNWRRRAPLDQLMEDWIVPLAAIAMAGLAAAAYLGWLDRFFDK